MGPGCCEVAIVGMVVERERKEEASCIIRIVNLFGLPGQIFQMLIEEI
jgi:hypothetical protein